MDTVKVSGFTVIRNAELMGYPILASIRSLLPVVDELIIGVGQSDDNTRELINSINDNKIKIFDSFWDTSKTSGGIILSEKTNEALERCENDWCFYLQADEIIHEKEIPKIRQALQDHADNPRVQGLLFNYIHFYGSFDIIATSRKWYRREIRIIKKSSLAQSYKDAQGFRIKGKQKLQVAPVDAHIYHYGWVKPPQQMGIKSKLLNRWWHGHRKNEEFDNFQFHRQYGLHPYKDSHPRVMHEAVNDQNWEFSHHRSLTDWTLKDLNLLASDLFERAFKYRIGEYKPYRLLKNP